MIPVLRLLSLLVALAVAGCGSPPPHDAADMAELTRAIGALGPEVDPEEAARAAQVALTHTQVLAREYGITDPPLVHNAKVNMGLRPRGLCYQWADDLEARLAEEGFRTLTLHRAIANADNPFRIDHSTVIVARAGDSLFDGLVLDPWRKGGVLHWTPVLQDRDYNWVPRAAVFAEKFGIPPAAVAVARAK